MNILVSLYVVSQDLKQRMRYEYMIHDIIVSDMIYVHKFSMKGKLVPLTTHTT